MQLNTLYRPWAVDNTHWGIEIIEGKFAGSVIQIESVEFDEVDEGSLKVDYHNISIPDGILKEDYTSSEFVDTMQLIISDVVSKALEEFKESNGN
jgi:hypothetical protein